MLDSAHQQLKVLQASGGIIGDRAIDFRHVVVGGVTGGVREGGREGGRRRRRRRVGGEGRKGVW